jgi:Stress responsive A/B Barrel Domain
MQNLRSVWLGATAAALFFGGYAAGQNRYGTPKTIIHVVTIQWKPGTTPAQQKEVLDGVRRMAAEIPGIKNVWLKPERVQPRGYDAAFAIEFEGRAAADRYAESPVHKAWDQQYLAIRQASFNVQVGN